MKHVFIVGSKGIPANYGGFETFVDELVSRQQDKNIKYHVACMNTEQDIVYKNADCFSIKVPNVGPAKAVIYDLKAIKHVTKLAKEQNIHDGVLYILACRIGPFIRHVTKKLRQRGFKIYVNPDGHEWMRAKWNTIIKKYWKFSEKLMVKNADLLICDSKNIEKYIHDEYQKYNPKTIFIAYGAGTTKSKLKDNSRELLNWYKKFNIKANNYYLVVGRFVPENNYETIIREFMNSNTKKDLVIITNVEHNKFYDDLLASTHFDQDPRIKFVGTVYDKDLLKKIRELSYAYIHGHSVGGTNPSLLEALASTDINILYDCGFNREVAENGALYFTKAPRNLTTLIESTDKLSSNQIQELSEAAKNRIKDNYSWNEIVKQYEKLFSSKAEDQKIKILYLHAGADLYGSDKILLNIVKNLDQNIFEPIVILPNKGPLLKKLGDAHIRTKVIPYPIIRRKYFNFKGIINFFWSYYHNSKKLYSFAKSEQIDIVHNNTIAVLEGIYLKKKLGIKLVTHIHEMLEKPQFVAKYLYKKHLKHCDKVIVVSSAVKKHIKKTIKISNNKIAVVHNGIDTPNIHQNLPTASTHYRKINLPKNAKVIGFVGRINAIKGYDDFVKSLNPIINKDHNVYGLIVGDAYDGQKWRVDALKKNIEEKGLQNNIIYCGFRDDMEMIYQIMDLLILSSVGYDSFPTVVLEAMSMGIPTIAYKCGGVEEMLINGYNGYLIEQGNTKQLSQCIEKAIHDRDALYDMQKNARTHFQQHFTTQKFINNLLKQYKDMLV